MTRAIVLAYRSVLSMRLDGEIHVVDARGITHVVLGKSPWKTTGCGVDIHDNYDDYMPMFSNKEDARPTWNDVDCITCLKRGRP